MENVRYCDSQMAFLSEPIKKHENASHPITVLKYYTALHRDISTSAAYK
jgi:hypothetical protein